MIPASSRAEFSLKRLSFFPGPALSVDSIERYDAGDDRKGVILKIQEMRRKSTTKILIDLKCGQSSIDQVFDAVYGVGKDCSKRVIVYDGADNENDSSNPTADHYVVGSLIKAMDAYPLNLYHVKPNEYAHGPETYDLSKLGIPTKKFSMKNLPSPLQFRIAEFWAVIYDSLNEGFYHSWEAFDGGIRNSMEYGHYFGLNGLDLTLDWSETGIDITVIQTEDDNDYLRQIWSMKEDELRKQFREIQFEYLPGRLPKIKIKYSDRPLSWLATAGLDEKIEFAKQLHNNFIGFQGDMDEILWDVKESEAA